MKKTLFTLLLTLFATNINAQLVVDSLGRVGVGTETPKSMLSIGSSGDSLVVLSCNTSNKETGISFSNSTNSADATLGCYSQVKNNIGDCTGAKIKALGSNNTDLSQEAVGLLGCAGRSHTAVGVLGGKQIGNTVNFAGVYGTSSLATPDFSNYSGTYAGFFKGTVRVTNGIYATVLSPSTSPSPSGQSGITILSGKSESVIDKLNCVQAIQFQREGADKRVNAEGFEADEPQLSPIQYGLAADQLKTVYPELVYEDANGNVSINYMEMIPLLVQSINELSAKVETLEQQLGVKKNTRKSKQQPTSIETPKESNPNMDASSYDLSGRRVANPQHGVYVRNGKKVAVK